MKLRVIRDKNGRYRAEVKEGFFSSWTDCYLKDIGVHYTRYISAVTQTYDTFDKAKKACKKFCQAKKNYQKQAAKAGVKAIFTCKDFE